MAATWQIQLPNGDIQTFKEANIYTATKTCISQDVDSCLVVFERGDIRYGSPWDYDDEIKILKDSAVWFRGNVRNTTTSASGKKVRVTVQLVGPWWHLQNLVYLQSAVFVDDPDENPTPASVSGVLQANDFQTSAQLSSRVILGDDSSGDKANSSEMITDVLNYAISKGVPLQIGTINTGVDLPQQKLDATTCAEAIRLCLRWTPDQTVSFDYTTNPATINIRSRANLTAKTIDIEDGETEEIAIEALYNLLLKGFRLEYYTENERDGFTFKSLEIDSAGAEPPGIGGLVYPVDLYGSYIFRDEVISAEAPPAGIAALVYSHWSTLHYGGRVKLAKRDVEGIEWLKFKINISNGNPDWSSIGAVIQSAIEDSFSGRTELTLGPPRHLGPQDLVGLLRAGRTPEPPTVQDKVTKLGGGVSQQADIPSNAIEPRLTFAPGEPQPDIILELHQYWVNFGGAGVQYRGSWDHVTWRENEEEGYNNYFPSSPGNGTITILSENPPLVVGHVVLDLEGTPSNPVSASYFAATTHKAHTVTIEDWEDIETVHLNSVP